MIHRVNIMGAQCNVTHAQPGQSQQEWGPPQWEYYVSLQYNDTYSCLNNVRFRPGPSFKWHFVVYTKNSEICEW